jgi:hypothetical protein
VIGPSPNRWARTTSAVAGESVQSFMDSQIVKEQDRYMRILHASAAKNKARPSKIGQIIEAALVQTGVYEIATSTTASGAPQSSVLRQRSPKGRSQPAIADSPLPAYNYGRRSS